MPTNTFSPSTFQAQLDFLEILEEVRLLYKPMIKASQRPKISSSQDVFNLVVSTWEGICHFESFKGLYLTRSNRVLGLKTLSKGGIGGTVVDPKLVFQTALLLNASSIILLHNHPSGTLKPSEADKNLTKKLKQGGVFLDLPIFDHIIVSEEGYYSFADEGIF